MVDEVSEYTITEPFSTARNVCEYLCRQSIDSTMSGKSYNGTNVIIYTLNITEEDALFITLTFPDVKVNLVKHI